MVDLEAIVMSILLLYSLTTLLGIASVRGDEVLFQRDALLEPFSNDHLPTRYDSSHEIYQVQCFKLIGCFELLPIPNEVPESQQFGISFNFYDRNGEDKTVVSGQYKNCLHSDNKNCGDYLFNLQHLIESPFDVNRRTIIIINWHPLQERSSWEWELKDLWLELDDVNVIIVDPLTRGEGSPEKAAHITRIVGRSLTVLLYYLAQLNGLSLYDDSFDERLYLVGYSLGAQVAAFVGRDLAGMSGRITGLDPAGKIFDGLPTRFRLDRSDARLVDTLRTNARSRSSSGDLDELGSGLDNIGHLDYYANDGQHQPACHVKTLGCSHSMARTYYSAILSQELAMRDYLDEDYDCRRPNRLRAFASNTFQRFRSGLSLRERCPVAALDVSDKKDPDLNRCSIPIDYLSWFDEFKEELSREHGVEFHGDNGTGNNQGARIRYFFYTRDTPNFVGDHYLLQIKAAGWVAESSEAAKRMNCGVKFVLEMKDTLSSKYSISNCGSFEGDTLKEIVLPFLPPESRSKEELDKMSKHAYHLRKDNSHGTGTPDETETRIRQSLDAILPYSVKIMSSAIQSIESISVKPMRELSRKMCAFYSRDKLEQPEIFVRDGEDLWSLGSKENQSNLVDETSKGFQPEVSETSFYIKEVVLGPADASVHEFSQNIGRTSLNKSTDQRGTKFWMVMTMISCLFIMLVTTISMICMTKRPQSSKIVSNGQTLHSPIVGAKYEQSRF